MTHLKFTTTRVIIIQLDDASVDEVQFALPEVASAYFAVAAFQETVRKIHLYDADGAILEKLEK